MDKFEKLEKLNDLKNKGIISDAEFEEQKQSLLSEADEPAPSGKMISIGEAYKSYWKKSFVWSGRATRAEYWWPVLVNWLISLALSFFGNVVLGLVYMAFSIANIFPSLAVLVRRFHDLGKSAWFAFAPLFLMIIVGVFAGYSTATAYLNGGAPSQGTGIVFVITGLVWFVVGITWLVFLCMPGQKTANRYGDPK